MSKNYKKFYIRRIYNNKEEILYQSSNGEEIRNIFNKIIDKQGESLETRTWDINDPRWKKTYFLLLEGVFKINTKKYSNYCYNPFRISSYFPIIRRSFTVDYVINKGFDIKSLEDHNIKIINPDIKSGLCGCDPPKSCILEANYYEDIDKTFNKLLKNRCISWFSIVLNKDYQYVVKKLYNNGIKDILIGPTSYDKANIIYRKNIIEENSIHLVKNISQYSKFYRIIMERYKINHEGKVSNIPEIWNVSEQLIEK